MRDLWLVYLVLGALTLFIILHAWWTASRLAPEAVWSSGSLGLT